MLSKYKQRIIGFIFSCCIVAPLVAPLTSQAQTVGAVAAQIDPGRVQKRFSQQFERQAQVPGAVSLPAEALEKDLAGAKKTTFILRNVRFAGATAIPEQELQAIFLHAIDTRISLADLQDLVNQVTIKYRDTGYVLSQAILPPQEITRGTVTIQIVEGFVDSVRIQGKITNSLRLMMHAYGQHVIQQKPLRLDVLERYALLANDLPGVTVKTVLSPSKDTPGAATLVFVVEQKLLEAQVNLNNQGTRLLGRNQFSGFVGANGLLHGSATRLQGAATDEFDEVRYIQLSHEQPIGSSGLKFTMSAGYTETKPDFQRIGLGPLDVEGRSNTYTFTLSYPVIRARSHNLFVYSEFDLLDTDTDINGLQLFDDKIRSLRLGTSFDAADAKQGVNNLGFELSQGLSAFGAKADPASRNNGTLDYTKIEAHLSRLQFLPRHFSLLLSARGQYSFSNLLSSEEFGVGGIDIGRGYDPSEITGDRGLAGKAELRYDFIPDVPVLDRLQLFGFYDAGVVWNINTNAQLGRESIVSAGGGLRMLLTEYLSTEAYIARPINKIVNNEDDKRTRFFISVVGRI